MIKGAIVTSIDRGQGQGYAVHFDDKYVQTKGSEGTVTLELESAYQNDGGRSTQSGSRGIIGQ